MPTMELAELLKKPEGKTLEFKRDLSSPDGAIKSVVAFANTSGGILLVGVEDRSRQVLGVSDPLALEERLASLIADRVQPTLLPELEILSWRDTHVLSAQIHPSPARPHHVKALGPEQGVFVRIGSTNRRADRALIEELRRFAGNRSFDEEPIPESSSEALDFRAASELFADHRRLRKEDLRTLRLTTEYQGRQVPTVGGLILFGRDRLTRFPDAWIQVGRFEGSDRRRILDTSELRSYPPIAIEEAIGFVRRNTAREVVIEGARRVDRYSYPLEAVREAVVNSVVHADYAQQGAPIRISIYDDRMEIENPGLLPFGLTIEEIRGGVSKLRNRVIGRVFNELGLIEHWGSGIQRMTAALQQAGLAPPALEEIATRFRVTLLSARETAPRVDQVEGAILDVLRPGKGLPTAEIAERVGRSTRATRARLQSLIDRGLVVVVGSAPNDPRRVYYLAEGDLGTES